MWPKPLRESQLLTSPPTITPTHPLCIQTYNPYNKLAYFVKYKIVEKGWFEVIIQVKAQGSRVKGQGPESRVRVEGQGPRSKSQGSRLKGQSQGSRVKGQGVKGQVTDCDDVERLCVRVSECAHVSLPADYSPTNPPKFTHTHTHTHTPTQTQHDS